MTINIDQIFHWGRTAIIVGDLNSYRKSISIVGKVIRDFALNGRIDEALILEQKFYQNLVKQVENEENYFESFRWHKEALFAAGMRLKRENINPTKINNIAFIVQNGVLLGHTQVLLKILHDWKVEKIPFKPHVISLSGFSDELAARLRCLNVEMRCYGVGTSTPSRIMSWCRDVIDELCCETAVWLSVPTWVSYAFGMGMAPTQILWSLKFHPIYLGGEIKHIAMTPSDNGLVFINGSPWLSYCPPLSINLKLRTIEEIDSVRRKIGAKFIFGSLARTEKFNSTDFVRSVAKVVERCEDSVYIYTGAEDSKVIQNIFDEYGLGACGIFVGWVDTELYSQLIDVFLETFPAGCGITGAQAVNAGTATVSLWSHSTVAKYYFNSPEEASQSCPHWEVVDTEADFVEAAVGCYKKSINRQFTGKQYSLLSKMEECKSMRLFKLIAGERL